MLIKLRWSSQMCFVINGLKSNHAQILGTDGTFNMVGIIGSAN